MARCFLRTAAAAVLAVALAMGCAGHAAALETRPQGIGPAPKAPTGILVNIPARTLYWYSDGELVRSFPVGVGKPSTQTPVGSYRVENKAVDPWWLPPSGGPAVPPGPSNPLGTRWIGFWGGYGIHGNNNPASIGHLVSLGCVRMYTEDVEWLYEQVQIGTPVEVIYEPVLIEYGPDGRRYLAVYPDGYGRAEKTPGAVLEEAGLLGEAVAVTGPGHYLLDITASLNGEPLPAVIHHSRPHVPAHAFETSLYAAVKWDEASGQVELEGHLLPTVLRDGKAYVDAAEAAFVLGLAYRWDEEEGHAALQGLPHYLVEGQLLTRRGTAGEAEMQMPVLLAERLSLVIRAAGGAVHVAGMKPAAAG